MAIQAGIAEQNVSLAAVTRHTFLELQFVDAGDWPLTLCRRERAFTDSLLVLAEADKPEDKLEDEQERTTVARSDASSTGASWASDDEACPGEPASRAASSRSSRCSGCSGCSARPQPPLTPPGAFAAAADTQPPAPAGIAVVFMPVPIPVQVAVSAPAMSASAPAAQHLLRRPRVEPWRKAIAALVAEDARTTLVLKHLPEGCTRASLVELLNQSGFFGKFDFVYIPAHFRSWTLFRYAFVNFSSCADAAHALRQLQGQLWPGAAPEEGLEVTWSEVHQGLAVHVERYRNSPLLHALVPDEYKPMLLRNGLRAKFPRPSQRLVPPRSLPGRPSAK